MASDNKKSKAAAQTGLYLLVIAGILVLANILSFGNPRRWDVTKNERYTLSKGSERLVQSLNTPVQVDAYVTRGLAQLDAFVRDLTDLLKEYERKSNGKFRFTLIEAKTDELKEQAKEAGLQETAFGEAAASGEDQASIAQGYMGLVFKYGSEKGVIPQLAPGRSDGLEFWITNKIREIRDKSDDIKHRVGVITGKDELKLSDNNLVPRQGRGGAPSMQSILEQAFPFYKLEEIDLKDGETEIDPAIAGLIITQPRKSYSEKELRRIDQFLMRGGKSLAVFASAVTIKPQDPSMSATLDTHGLDKLLAGYGIQLNQDAVLDFGAQFRVPVMTQTGAAQWLRHPGIAHVVNDPRFEGNETLLDTGFAGFFRMDQILFPFPSSLTLKPEAQPEAKISALARTTPQASVVTGSSADMNPKRADWEPKPPMEQRIIAAVAEGKLKSAFPAGDVQRNDVSPEPSRVLVVSSSLFLTNPYAYAGNGPDLGGQFAMFGGVGGDPQLQMISQPYAQKYLTATILSLKNTLDWLTGDADLIAASAKILSEPNLAYTNVAKPKFSDKDDETAIKRKDEEYRQARKAVQDRIRWSLTLGVPLAFVALGLGRWRWRESKRNQRRI